MAITTIIKEVKNIHKQELIIVKIGNFYHVLNRSYLAMERKNRKEANKLKI